MLGKSQVHGVSMKQMCPQCWSDYQKENVVDERHIMGEVTQSKSVLEHRQIGKEYGLARARSIMTSETEYDPQR